MIDSALAQEIVREHRSISSVSFLSGALASCSPFCYTHPGWGVGCKDISYEKRLMPKRSTHALVWSTESKSYTLSTDGHIHQHFVPGEEEPWFAWLGTQTSFSFQGRCGHLSVIKEARPRGEGYWYAYTYVGQRSRKQYLGRTAMLSLARLEAAAQALTTQSLPAASGSVHLPSPVLLTPSSRSHASPPDASIDHASIHSCSTDWSVL